MRVDCMRRALSSGVVVVCFAGFGGVSLADTLGVPADHTTIQAAIDAAGNGDLILVSPGVYAETIDFLGKEVIVRALEGPGATTIDGNGGGPVVSFVSGETRDARLIGFTITGGVAVNGGGALIDGASPMIDLCWFVGNESTGTALDEGGGAIAVLNACSPVISRCVMNDNVAESLGGGLMAIFDPTPLVSGCVIADNTATFGGGVANELGAAPDYVSVTITGNAANIAPGICNFQASCTISNSIVWGQTQNVTNLAGGSATARYSLIGGSYPGLGNINLNPVFEPDAGSVQFYRQAAGSPTIDRGENASAAADELDLDGDTDEGEAAPMDLLGGARFVDDPATIDAGSGTAPLIDMGASEYFVAAPGCNAADLAEPYGSLDFSDVIAFLTAFGTMGADADIAEPFGQWDFSDVIGFLGAFGGGCP